LSNIVTCIIVAKKSSFQFHQISIQLSIKFWKFFD
jgi:hypothetical protein